MEDSGEPPIIVKPGVYDGKMGLCIEIKDGDGEWLIDEQSQPGKTIVTIPNSAHWQIDRKHGNQNVVVIYIEGKEARSVELKNFEKGAGTYAPGGQSECVIDFRDKRPATAA